MQYAAAMTALLLAASELSAQIFTEKAPLRLKCSMIERSRLTDPGYAISAHPIVHIYSFWKSNISNSYASIYQASTKQWNELICSTGKSCGISQNKITHSWSKRQWITIFGKDQYMLLNYTLDIDRQTGRVQSSISGGTLSAKWQDDSRSAGITFEPSDSDIDQSLPKLSLSREGTCERLTADPALMHAF
jgi:hypothetical protein